MAAPTYATDLTTIVDFDVTPLSPSVSEPSTGWTSGRSPTTDTDFPIQGTYHASLTMNTTGKAGVLCDNASSFAWTSGDYLFGWLIWLAPGAIATHAAGGLAMLCGDGVGAYKVFYVGGNDFGLYPYGGWQNFAVDPEMTEDEVFGSPAGYYIVGGGANVLSQVSKGNPLGFDVFRYGRGEFRVAAGDGTTPATFVGMAATNDASAARWGLFQAIAGSYKFKGLMILGYGGAVTFVDQNKTIVIDDTQYVQSDFNAIEIRTAASSVTWTNVTILSLSSVSPGTFTVVDNATVLLDGCTFTDMGAFTFLSNTTADGSAFRRCGQVDAGGASMVGAKVVLSTVAADGAALLWDVATDPDGLLDETAYTKGTNAHHAITFGTTAPTTMTLRNVDFGTDWNASDDQNDSTLNFLRTSGATTLNLVGCSGTISYKTTGTHTVTLVINPVTTTITVKDVTDGSLLTGARVLLKASDGTGDYPFEESVSIARSGTTATVTHAAHGLKDGDFVVISGCNEVDYNKAAAITYIDAGSYSYTVTESPSTPATGTPIATGAIFNTVTASGVVSRSRSFTNSQPVDGWVRLSTTPGSLYKTQPISGTISNTAGLSLTVQMIPDE